MDFTNLRLYDSKGFQVPMQYNHRIKLSFDAELFLTGENVGWQVLPEVHLVTNESGKVISAVTDNRGTTYGLDCTSKSDEEVTSLVASIKDFLVKDIRSITITLTDTEPGEEYVPQVGDTAIYTERKPSANEDRTIVTEKSVSVLRVNSDGSIVIVGSDDHSIVVNRSDLRIVGKHLTIDRDDPNYASFFTTDTLNIQVRDTVVNGNRVLEFYLKSIDHTVLEDVLTIAFPGERLYPSFQFLAEVMMEPASTELAATSTLFLVEEYTDEEGTLDVRRPHSDNQVIKLEVSNTSETKFVKDASLYWAEDADQTKELYTDLDWSKVYFSNYKYLDLRDNGDQVFGTAEREPFIFTLGFVTEHEGCYKNLISVYVYNNVSSDGQSADEPIHIGYIVVNSEAIGEDERYRTLFANFGVPDPKGYFNLFKEINPSEEGTDWDFINKKSKQLFLTYHEIFPYVGTYKALLNAVKFLGYDDIFFREWYQKFEEDEGATDITYKSLDIDDGLTLIDKLDRYNVTLEEFLKYKKLNKLSLVYKINQEKSTKKTINGTTKKLYQEFDSYSADYNTYGPDKKTGDITVVKKESGTVTFQVPMTEHVYDYETDEVLAKLYSLKLWLEKYIIGINARISDITGEGVYFNRYEHPGTAVGYYKIDEFKEKTVSPKFVDMEDLEMLDSSAVIKCTLKEFRNPTFENFYNASIVDFISYEETLNDLGYIDKIDPNTMYFHMDTAVPSLLSDFAFELYTDASSGTIKEGVSSPLLIKDNEIYFYTDAASITFGENGKRLPYIRIKKALLKKSFGKWRENTLHEIDYLMDVEKYNIVNKETGQEFRSSDYITLIPKTEDATLMYTSENKYRVPLFIIKGFDVAPENIDGIDRSGWKDFTYLDPDMSYILYITDGFIECDETPSTQADGVTVTAQLRFENFYTDEDPDSEQNVYIRYIYKTRRRPLWTFNDRDFIHDYNLKVDEIDASLDTIRENNNYEDGEAVRLAQEEYGSKWHYYNDMRTRLDEKIFNYRQMLNKRKNSQYKEFITYNIEKLEKQIKTLENLMTDLVKEQEKYITLQREKVNTTYDISVNDKLEELYLYKQSLVEQYCNINEITPVKVRHLGEYNLTAKAWDTFNVIYTNTAKNRKRVWGEKPYVYLHTTRQQTLHETYDTSLDKSLFLHGDDASSNLAPLFDENYRRFGITATGDASFTYTVASYQFDTPKKGNYIKMDNVSEKVSHINYRLVDSSNGGQVVVYTDKEGNDLEPGRICFTLLDENFDEQNLFYPGSEYAIYFIDSRTHNLIGSGGTCGPYTLEEYNKVEYDMNQGDDNYIIAGFVPNDKGFNDIQSTFLADVSEGTMECYITNVTEEKIDLSFVTDSKEFPLIENDLVTRTALLRIPTTKTYAESEDFKDRYCLFRENQLIKVMFYQHMDDEASEDGWDKYITGTTYRVIKVNEPKLVQYVNDDGEIEEDKNRWYQEYLINGCVNYHIGDHSLYNNEIQGFDILCKVTAVHNNFVSYILRASDDAVEEFNTDTCMVPINNEWFAADYIDRTFSFILNDFDYNEAIDNWIPGLLGSSQKLFGRNTLSLISEGESVVATYDDWRGAFHSCKPVWNIWKQFDKDDLTDRELWMKVHNQYVPLKVNDRGMYRFCLDIVDPWGNVLTQTQQGFLNVGEI